MRRNTIKKIFSFVLSLVLTIGTMYSVKAAAIGNDKHPNPYLYGKAISAEGINLDYKGITKLPTSLGINEINIDVDNLHDTNPITTSDEKILLSKGYSQDTIKVMNRGDLLKLRKTWSLNPEEVEAAKVIYPELNNINLASWTYGQFLEYSIAKDAQKYSPSMEQAKKLLDKGITLADARYMLKDFYTYDSILNLTDDAIKEYLTSYYKLKQNYAKSLKAIERHNKKVSENNLEHSFSINSSTTTVIHDGATYYRCYIPGYGYDDFHETSQTHIGSNDLFYGAEAQNIFKAIYPIVDTYNASNMWGTYSLSNSGAHEGIDFNGTPECQSLKAIVNGSLGYRNSSYGYVAISSSEDDHAINYRIFYMHMTNISSASTINTGDTIGKEGGVGPSGTNAYDEHLHLQVYHNQTKTYCDTSSDNVLQSDSPYSIFIYTI